MSLDLQLRHLLLFFSYLAFPFRALFPFKVVVPVSYLSHPSNHLFEVLSPQDKALSAVEEMILQIADLNATVGPGYLTVFSHAREALEEMRGGGEQVPSVTQVGGRAVEVDRLKDQEFIACLHGAHLAWGTLEQQGVSET